MKIPLRTNLQLLLQTPCLPDLRLAESGPPLLVETGEDLAAREGFFLKQTD